MRRILAATLLTTAAAIPAFAQTTTIVVEPVPAQSSNLLNAPIEYDANGVAKAQYFRAEDLSPAELDAILAEADRVRGYQQSNGIYVRPETAAPATVYQEAATTSTPQSYEIELYAEPVQTAPITSYETTVASASTIHTVAKGDTLYNISKRYGVKVADLQQSNGIAGSAISLGQQLTIPGQTVISQNMTGATTTFASAPTQTYRHTTETYVQPTYTAPAISYGTQQARRVVEPVPQTSQTREVTTATDTIYAVLPKDTLYAISRRSCTAVPALIAANGLADANTLKPGQRLTIPAGHCLTN